VLASLQAEGASIRSDEHPSRWLARSYFFGSGFTLLVVLLMHPHPHSCDCGCLGASGGVGSFGLSLIYAPPSG
jgi:hypothetical protein